MNEQFTFSGFESPEYQEISFLEPLLPALKDAVADAGGSPNDLAYKSTKSDTSGGGYTVVFSRNLQLFVCVCVAPSPILLYQQFFAI